MCYVLQCYGRNTTQHLPGPTSMLQLTDNWCTALNVKIDLFYLKLKEADPRKVMLIIQIRESNLHIFQNTVCKIKPKTGKTTHSLFIFIIRLTS